jgi:hypothetical protein
MIEEEVARRVEELVAKRVEEELEKRKEEIEAEVLRRVEEAKKIMEIQMLNELESQRQAELEAQRKKEVKPAASTCWGALLACSVPGPLSVAFTNQARNFHSLCCRTFVKIQNCTLTFHEHCKRKLAQNSFELLAFLPSFPFDKLYWNELVWQCLNNFEKFNQPVLLCLYVGVEAKGCYKETYLTFFLYCFGKRF